MLSFQPPVKTTRANPALQRSTFNGNNDNDEQKDIDKQKDNDDDKEKDDGDADLEGQGHPTVVVVERDWSQGAQNCSHYYQHSSLSFEGHDGWEGQVDLWLVAS